ncbi:hypothetical protein QAD02_003138 [Eretmocerus hayati]|uniref:Uncharacterized protein n=1 Tax=Eretmocerus hayati TaxID=131215 RepID=A0ACC2NLA1_9HYME|nr:hypothetical protein QAD02_003138 [Eretmocerus hayati]
MAKVYQQIELDENEISKIFREVLPEISKKSASSLRSLERRAKKCHKIIGDILNSTVDLPQSTGRKEALEAKADRLKRIYLILERERLGRKESSVIFFEGESAFRRRIRSGIVGNIYHSDPIEFLKEAQNSIVTFIQSAVRDLKFKNFHKKEAIPCVIYVDTECLLKLCDHKLDGDPHLEVNDIRQDDSYTENEEDPISKHDYPELKKSEIMKNSFQKHEAYSIGFYYHDRYEEDECFYDKFRGLNCVRKFAERLEEIAIQIQRDMRIVRKNFTEEIERSGKEVGEVMELLTKKGVF